MRVFEIFPLKNLLVYFQAKNLSPRAEREAQGVLVNLQARAKRDAKETWVNLSLRAEREAQGVLVNLQARAKREAKET